LGSFVTVGSVVATVVTGLGVVVGGACVVVNISPQTSLFLHEKGQTYLTSEFSQMLTMSMHVEIRSSHPGGSVVVGGGRVVFISRHIGAHVLPSSHMTWFSLVQMQPGRHFLVISVWHRGAGFPHLNWQ